MSKLRIVQVFVKETKMSKSRKMKMLLRHNIADLSVERR
jgi:hypothetical protein